MSTKQKYRIRNWSEYNKALRNRGSLTVWIDPKSLASWYSSKPTYKRGRPMRYSDIAIQCCLTLKGLFHLPLRATQGFVDSLFELMRLPLNAPDYSILSRRAKCQVLSLSKQAGHNDPLHLVVDATGLKLYGEGEWKVKKHGQEKRRTWLKLHLGINTNNHDIEACLLTADDVHDSEVFNDLLAQVNDELEQVTADGAYDTHDCYLSAIKRGAKPCFPPRKNAVRHKPSDQAWIARNHAVSQQIYHGLKYWKRKNNYHQRSLVETAMFRFKQLFGAKVRARTCKTQATEVGIKCLILNKMNQLGMPDTVRI